MTKNLYNLLVHEERTYTQGANPDIPHQYTKPKPRELLVIIPAITLIRLCARPHELALGMRLE